MNYNENGNQMPTNSVPNSPVQPQPVNPVQTEPVVNQAPARPVQPQPGINQEAVGTVQPQPTVNQAATSSVQQGANQTNIGTQNYVPPVSHMNPGTVNPTNAFANNQNVPVAPNTKKGNKNIFMGVGAVVILAVLFVLYQFVFNNPKNVFLGAINREFSSVGKTFASLVSNRFDKNSIVDTKATLDFNMNLMDGILEDDDAAILQELNNLDFVINSQFDRKGKKLYYGIDIRNDESSMINLNVYGKDNSIYLELKDIFDKYIEVPVDGYDALFEDPKANIDDLEYMLDFSKKSIINSLEKDDFTQTKENLTIDGKTVKVKKITYRLNEKKVNKIAINLLKDIKDDKEFVEIVSSMTGISKDEFKENLNNSIESLEENDSYGDSTIKFSIYTKGLFNKAVRIEMEEPESEVGFVYTNYNDVKTYSFEQSSEALIKVVNKKESKNKYKTTITMSTIKLVINSTEDDDNWEHKYSLTESESTFEVKGTLKLNSKEISKKKQYKDTFEFTLSIGAEDTEDVITADIKVESNSKVISKISIPDVSNSVLANDLTEADTTTIGENLLQNETLVDFITTISSYINTPDSDYDDDYDYDYDDTYGDDEISYSFPDQIFDGLEISEIELDISDGYSSLSAYIYNPGKDYTEEEIQVIVKDAYGKELGQLEFYLGSGLESEDSTYAFTGTYDDLSDAFIIEFSK